MSSAIHHLKGIQKTFPAHHQTSSDMLTLLRLDVISGNFYRVDRNLAVTSLEPVLWTLDTYVGGLRFDQDLTLLEIKLGFKGKHLVGRWCAGRIFMVSSK